MDSKEKKELIISELKGLGLDVAEDALMSTVTNAFDVIEVVVNKFSAGAGIIVKSIRGIVEPPLLSLIDKLDGEKDLA